MPIEFVSDHAFDLWIDVILVGIFECCLCSIFLEACILLRVSNKGDACCRCSPFKSPQESHGDRVRQYVGRTI